MKQDDEKPSPGAKQKEVPATQASVDFAIDKLHKDYMGIIRQERKKALEFAKETTQRRFIIFTTIVVIGDQLLDWLFRVL